MYQCSMCEYFIQKDKAKVPGHLDVNEMVGYLLVSYNTNNT